MNAKDLLRRVLDCWDFNDDPYFDDVNGIIQEIRAYLSTTSDDAEELELEEYDAGLLGYFGGGDVEWWQDYIRDLLGRAHDHYQSQVSAHPPKPAEPEAEPVAWMHVYKTHKEPNLFPLLTHECEAKGLTQYPLYTRPSPARKPLSDVEIADIYYRGMCFEKGYLSAFAEGFRKAEKHHEIGGDDE